MGRNLSPSRHGASTIEIVVAVVLVVVLLAVGIPRFRDAVERAKAAEAFSYLVSLRNAQELHRQMHGKFALKIGDLPLNMTPPKFFVDESRGQIGASTPFTFYTNGSKPGWRLGLLRQAKNSEFGEYTVIFTDEGLDPSSTIARDPDLNSRINPIAN